MPFYFTPPPYLLESPIGRTLYGDVPDALTIDSSLTLPDACEIAIIGGGIASIALATRLWHCNLLHQTIIIEQASSLAETFFSRISKLRQRVMRSPYEHHVGAEYVRDCEMLDFARVNWRHLTDIERGEIRMAQSGQRSVVPVDVFCAYIRHAVEAHQIRHQVRRGHVNSVQVLGPHHFVLNIDGRHLTARNVIWAVGDRARPLPEWVKRGQSKKRVSHWEEPGQDDEIEHAVVVGAGMSAAHLLLNLREAGIRVTWIVRKQERYQCTDVNALYFRPEGRSYFLRQSLAQRLECLQEQQRASIMLEFEPIFRSWEEQGGLVVYRQTEVLDLEPDNDGVHLRLSNGMEVHTNHVYTAFGMHPVFSPPLISEGKALYQGRPYPLADDKTLELLNCPGAFVCGSLASLSIGPAARNIDGARIAADRIVSHLVQLQERKV